MFSTTRMLLGVLPAMTRRPVRMRVAPSKRCAPGYVSLTTPPMSSALPEAVWVARVVPSVRLMRSAGPLSMA